MNICEATIIGLSYGETSIKALNRLSDDSMA